MAAIRNVSNTPLSTKYKNEEAPDRSIMPSGGCNYTNLALGVNAVRCGCRRYYDRDTGSGTVSTGFCMCEHHACYHDHSIETQASITRNSTTTQSKPKGGQSQSPDGTLTAILDPGESHNEAGHQDLMHWSRYLIGSSQGLPPIPSECLLPSDNGSMTSGYDSAYYRPFGGQGLDTLSHIRRPDRVASDAAVSAPRMQIYEDRYGVQHLQSLTDVASPSVHTSQDVEADRAKNVLGAATKLQTINEAPGSQISVPLRPGSQQSQGQIKQSNHCSTDKSDGHLGQQLVLHEQQLRDPNDISARVTQHENRLEQLENVSFSHPAIDQLQEAHEHLDDRIGNLEHRISDLETTQLANDSGSISTRQSVEESFDSRTSRHSSIIPHIELSRVEALEAQIAELQAIAVPTYSRPWEVEVVLLPFGTNLMGIWSSSGSISQFSRAGSIAPPESSQPQYSLAVGQARLTTHDQDSAWEQSATDAVDYDPAWLMAKACGVGSKVDKRLRSRGLVKKIQICGPDARDVQSAMLKAFGELPDVLAEDPYASQDEGLGDIPESLRNYLGLQAPWVPLRKIHKDSCLRFLNPAEMVTPALWTVNFLSSSVAMRHSATRRLYLTQRDSYIQQHGDKLTNWTWQKLRQLPRVYENSIAIHTPEADAQEECWAYDSRLDPPPTPHSAFHSSFHSQISQLSIDSLPGTPTHMTATELEMEPVSPSDHFSSAPASPTISTPRTSLPPALPTPVKQRNPFRPAPRRTISMSSAIPLKGQASSQTHSLSSKRRVPSFNRDTHSSPTPQTNTLGAASASTSQPLRSLEITTKRRRISRSPSRPRNTPRWSLGSPSPLPVFEGDGERGLTPFAYATPHSNATYGPRSGGGVDVYEDEDDDADYFVGHGSEEGRESTTDISDDDEGYDQNALSDFEGSLHDVNDGNDGWDGVHDDARNVYDSRYKGMVGRSFSSHHDDEQDRQVEDDAVSDISESPSEYPSTQQQAASREALVVKPIIKAVSPTGLYERRQKRGMGFTIHVDDETEGA